jgi:ribose transport system substrate-binding protein/inositol transport system substrate-binding protein
MGDLAARQGLAYRIYDSDGDAYRQLTLIERARADGAGGLIVCPLNANLLATPLGAASEAGIPLVLLASDMPSYGGVVIAGDDAEMGLRAGRYAGEIVAREKGGHARVVILGFPELPNLVRRAQGLERGLKEQAPRARIVGHARGGTREFAEASVGELIARGQSFDVLLSINDAGAIGAIAAIERAGWPPASVVITSVDAEALAREYIAQGRYLRGSVAIDREQFSRAAVGAMTRLLAGATLPETFVVSAGPVVTRVTSPPAP